MRRMAHARQMAHAQRLGRRMALAPPPLLARVRAVAVGRASAKGGGVRVDRGARPRVVRAPTRRLRAREEDGESRAVITAAGIDVLRRGVHATTACAAALREKRVASGEGARAMGGMRASGGGGRPWTRARDTRLWAARWGVYV